MKKGWTVTLEGRAAKALDPEVVLEELAEYQPAVSYKDGLLSTTATVPAASPMQAMDFLYEALSEAVGKLVMEYGEAMTEERQAQDLEVSNLPDLVGLAEIAELAGTTRQRVFQMTANKGFPSALLELRSGRLWSRPAIESYLMSRQVDRRPIKTIRDLVGDTRAESVHRRVERALASRPPRK